MISFKNAKKHSLTEADYKAQQDMQKSDEKNIFQSLNDSENDSDYVRRIN